MESDLSEMKGEVLSWYESLWLLGYSFHYKPSVNPHLCV